MSRTLLFLPHAKISCPLSCAARPSLASLFMRRRLRACYRPSQPNQRQALHHYCRDRRERDFDMDLRIAISDARFDRSATDGESRCKENEMNGSRYYGVRVEGAKFG